MSSGNEDAQQHSPYFSTRIRIGDITSPKDLMGYKDFTIEITYGNQDTKRIIKSREDVADFEERTLFDEVDKLFEQRDNWAAKRGFVFVDQRNDEGKTKL